MDSYQPGSQTPPPSTPQGDSTNLMAIISYLSILVIIPLLSDAKNDPFVKFHIKQGLVLLICEVISYFIFAIPVFGYFLAPLLNLVFLVLAVIGIMHVVNKQTKELPVIGHFSSNFHF
jgi:uncharacterized membrane protein